MTIQQIAEKLSGEIIVKSDYIGSIDTFYAGDFLSRVMGKAPSGCAWFTVMANVNVAGVAVLADSRVVVLCEGVSPDTALIAKCSTENIAIITTKLPVFECCKLVS